MIKKILRWWDDFKYNIIPYSVLILVLTFIIWGFSIVGADMSIQAKCAKYGYPRSITTWNFKGYCIRTIEQTEYIVPLNIVLHGEK